MPILMCKLELSIEHGECRRIIFCDLKVEFRPSDQRPGGSRAQLELVWFISMEKIKYSSIKAHPDASLFHGNLEQTQLADPEGGLVPEINGCAASLTGAQLIAGVENLVGVAGVPAGPRACALKLDGACELDNPCFAGLERGRLVLR